MNNYEFILNDESIQVSAKKENNKTIVIIGDEKFEFEAVKQEQFYLEINGHRYNIAVVHDRAKIYVDIDSILFELYEPSDEDFSGSAGGHTGEKDKIYAPMPGKIVKLLVKEGEEVAEKQPMVIVEAMKMENQVNSRAKGKVKSINFSPGDQVDTDSPIIELVIEH